MRYLNARCLRLSFIFQLKDACGEGLVCSVESLTAVCEGEKGKFIYVDDSC